MYSLCWGRWKDKVNHHWAQDTWDIHLVLRLHLINTEPWIQFITLSLWSQWGHSKSHALIFCKLCLFLIRLMIPLYAKCHTLLMGWDSPCIPYLFFISCSILWDYRHLHHTIWYLSLFFIFEHHLHSEHLYHLLLQLYNNGHWCLSLANVNMCHSGTISLGLWVVDPNSRLKWQLWAWKGPGLCEAVGEVTLK